MNASLTVELLARGTAIGAFVGLALVTARGGMTPARLTGALFCLAAAAHTLTQLPESAPALSWAWPPIWALSVMGAGLFWAFVRELFEDRRTLTLPEFAPALLLLLLGLGGTLTPASLARTFLLLQNALSGILIVHALFIVWTGWRGDLVEPRRRLRGPILAISAVYAIAVIVVQIWEIYLGSARALSPLAAIALMSLGLLALGAFGRMEPELFGSPQRPEGNAEATASVLTGEDARLASTLERLMRDDRLHRDDGLTVAALALKLKVPEYRLRRLINQQLGHRNFSSFINQWRLAEAKAALSDPAQAATPISTIALDAGFGSLGPFNRAFKAGTGLTPSEYRAQASGSCGSAGAATEMKRLD
jgi:AraC-like DNA-binding protein